jgi:mRNA interferase MazF
MSKKYFPDRGDAVWLNFNPKVGHEQSGRKPAVVVSPKSYNKKVGLGLFCPITSQIKGYPFEVGIPDGTIVSGVVLSDQI